MSACGLPPDGRREPAEANYHLALVSRCPMMRARLLAALAAGLLLTITTPPSCGQTLRVAMTASDTPTTTGIPNNGGEGFRFCGMPAFDGLIDWDFTIRNGSPVLPPASPPSGRSTTATTRAGSSPCATVSNFTTARM